MIFQRPSSERGQAASGRPDSRYGFSFGGYYDPAWMGFGALRVLNEDRLDPGTGFPATRGANMELLVFVVSGELAHEDAIGGSGTVRAGQLQWLSAGHGVEHTERNASASEPLHLLRMWIQPSRLNHEPACARREAVPVDAHGWTVLASGDGREGSLAIRQDARVLQARLDRGETGALELDPSRLYWVQVVLGQVTVNEDRPLDAGDALGLREESGTLRVQGGSDERALLLLFDLPG